MLAQVEHRQGSSGGANGVSHAERIEREQTVRLNQNAGANGRERRRTLDDDDVVSGLAKRKRRCKTGDPGTRDSDSHLRP